LISLANKYGEPSAGSTVFEMLPTPTYAKTDGNSSSENDLPLVKNYKQIRGLPTAEFVKLIGLETNQNLPEINWDDAPVNFEESGMEYELWDEEVSHVLFYFKLRRKFHRFFYS
jgi:hypothetical protein